MPPKAVKVPPKAAGKKAPPAAIARMKEAIAQQRAAEDEARRAAEEAERRLIEEARLAEEERRREEAEREAEAERRRAETKQLKKERAANRGVADHATLERMKAAGFVIPDRDALVREAEREKQQAKIPKAPKPKPAPIAVAEAPKEVPQEDELADDWEVEIEREEARAAQKEAEKEQKTDAKEGDGVRRLRSPICCVLGHVDAGKTSLLDKMRSTNVQGGEAGGITQQIGATFFPNTAIVDATAELNEKRQYSLDVPGLLIIDTPGHESFSNLRSRGSSLCDIAVVVVDIMEGLQPQTKESLRMLRDRKCPFMIALNKVDRLYDWEAHEDTDIETTLAQQKKHVLQEYETRVSNALLQLQMEGFNAELYYRNKDVRRYVSVVPTSSRTGEGMSDLILLMVRLVQTYMEGKITYRDEVECTVLEVRPEEGLGMCIDVILVNGTLHAGDTIVLCGSSGPIRTTIRGLLTPQPLREMRVRSHYMQHRQIDAAIGVKITANDLEDVVAGTPVLVLRPDEDFNTVAASVMSEVRTLCNQDLAKEGVAVQSSTLGSLEALLSFLSAMKIPVSTVNIGNIHKRHIIPILQMQTRNPRYAILLAFDVTMSDEAKKLVEQSKVRVVQKNVIYQLFDAFREYLATVEKMEEDALRQDAVFPVELEIFECYHDRDPIILGVKVKRGILHVNTPVGFVHAKHREVVTVGRVMSIEREHKPMTIVKFGESVSVRIVNAAHPTYSYERFSDATKTLVSIVTRKSIDAVKHFSKELSQDAINLLRDLKVTQNVKDKAGAPSTTTTSETATVAASDDLPEGSFTE